MKTYWTNLNERERWVLGTGVICCVIYLFYLLFYAPLARAVHQKSQQLVEKQETLAWMQGVQQLYQAKKKPETLNSSQLLTVLADQLANTSFKAYPYQLQQTGSNEIQLTFDKVPYNAVLAWLWSLNEKYTLSIKQLNSEHTDTSGVVTFRLLISTK